MSEETKTFVFPDRGMYGGGVDPNLLLNNGGGWMSNPIWAIVFLAFIRGGLYGNDNYGGANPAFVSSQLNQAIAGNANALSNLSTHLDCSIGQVQTAISAIQSAIANLANQNGMSSMQIINAINAGDASLTNSLQSCCCNITNAVSTGFGNLAYENAAQFCQTRQAIADQTSKVLAKIDAVQDEAKNNKIAELTAQLTASNSRAERQAELAPIYKALNDIQCKQPNVVTVPANNGVLVPSCVAWNLGLQNLGLGYGFNPSGSIWS